MGAEMLKRAVAAMRIEEKEGILIVTLKRVFR
jgi:hypothetical protein